MTVYVDITQLEKGRANTGIQRVVKEFVKRASLSKSIVFKILILDEKTKIATILDNDEVGEFLKDIENYRFTKGEKFDLLSFKPKTPTAFFDLDSTWNVVFRRSALYPKLKENGFLIFNFIHDIIPVLFPEIVHDTTKSNFIPFIQSVYTYSDLVLFNSFSSQDDFLKHKKDFNITREIHTRVTGLGSDFLQTKPSQKEPFISDLLAKKYILFVGTIEPRKNQGDVLEAFDILVKKYPDLNLVFIGKNGWKIEALVNRIKNHPLKDIRLFSLNNIDDETLSDFYKNAFIVTYLSKYEGYGLPIAESLAYGNITITSKNSSMYEVGKNIADYVVYNSLNELSSLISLYYENEDLYNAKKEYIKENFKTPSWEQFYNSISDIFINYEKSLQLKEHHLNSLQFVFISIDKHNLEGTIKAVDKYVDFVKEYIIVTQPKLIKEFQSIKSSNKITIIDENLILKEHKNGFSKRDHVTKNWLLRTSLVNLDILEDEFIMLDDDNRPLKDINIEKFIAKDGTYNAFYFYTMLDWHYLNSDYDFGQLSMKTILSEHNYELLSYSSHSPQIINKKIFKEMKEKFFDIGLKQPIDEWSIYFNYAVSTYPALFNKKRFETLSWPANPTDWETIIEPEEYVFENYYKELYDIKFFNNDDTLEKKLEKKSQQLAPYKKSKEMFASNIDIYSKNNMVHEIAKFKTKDIEFYIAGIPYFVVVEQRSDMKIRINYKLFNPTKKDLEIAIVIFLDGGYRTLRNVQTIKNVVYQEAVFEFPIISHNLDEDIYDASFNVMINNKYVYDDISPYRMKLIVVNDKDVSQVLGNPKLLQGEVEVEEEKESTSLKNIVKSIPVIGWALRWSYNLLRLNNIKYNVYKHSKQLASQQELLEQYQQQLKNQKQQINTQNKQISTQEEQINTQNKQIENLIAKHLKNKKDIKDLYRYIDENLEKQIDSKIATELSFHSDSFEQRLEQFIFDTKIELNLKSEIKD
jgi:glycosyltransferase involved in cell wall biosynthesis